MSDSRATDHPLPLQPIPGFVGTWQIAEWTGHGPRPESLHISMQDAGRYLLSVEAPFELRAELSSESSLRHLDGHSGEIESRRVCASFWPETLQDRLIISVGHAELVIGARRDAVRGVPGWTLKHFLLDKTFRITAEAGAGNPHNPSRDHIHFEAINTHSTGSRYAGAFAIFANDEPEPYDRLLFDPGSGSLASFNGWRSIALAPALASGCVFAMFDPTRILADGGSLMPFETGRFLPIDNDIGVWGAEEG
ncbi:MAG: hypothetical protein AAGE94_02750 [Acidobacteriota bacterium]